ncbi:MAG: hypothetical protein ABFC94_18090 [Syntrophomonas sp.]
MALSPNFTCAQNVLYPNIIIAADTSTGSDGAISQRRIYCQDREGNYLVPSGTTTTYTQWAYVDSSISLNILTQDMALSIRVDWLNSSNVVLYTLTQQFCFPLYNQQFLYELVQLQGLTPSIPQDTNYDANLAILWTSVRGAINAVEVGDDISASQASLDRGTFLRLNQNLYF